MEESKLAGIYSLQGRVKHIPDLLVKGQKDKERKHIPDPLVKGQKDKENILDPPV